MIGKLALTKKRQLVVRVYSGSINETVLELEPQETKSALEMSLRMRIWAATNETVIVLGKINNSILNMKGTLEFSTAKRVLKNHFSPTGGEGLFLLTPHSCILGKNQTVPDQNVPLWTTGF